jgi:hypothetical protein
MMPGERVPMPAPLGAALALRRGAGPERRKFLVHLQNQPARRRLCLQIQGLVGVLPRRVERALREDIAGVELRSELVAGHAPARLPCEQAVDQRVGTAEFWQERRVKVDRVRDMRLPAADAP